MVTVSEIMQRNFLKLDSSVTITKTIGKLQQSDERYALVFDKRFKPSYRGVLDRILLIKSKIEPKTQISAFLVHPPLVTPDTDIFRAAELMYHNYPCLLPVKKGNKIIGVVRSRDILSTLPKFPALAKLKVTEVATTAPLIFKYETRLGDAVNIMKERHFSHAPIVDKMGRIISIFSITDLLKKHFLSPEEKRQGMPKARIKERKTFTGSKSFEADKEFMLDQPIGDAASVTVFTVPPTATLGTAVAEMFEHKVSDIIIAQDRKPIGILTTRDVLRAFFKLKAPEYWSIQFVGCEQLPGQLYDSVRQQVAEFYEKVRRAYFRNVIYFLVHIKEYEKKEHKKKKYSVHLRLATPAKIFTVEQAHFDLNTAISWALKAMDLDLLKFKEEGKKWWTVTGRHGKRQELGKIEKECIEKRGKVIRPKLIKRK
ncbi:MAG: CBS domain-containing protein [Candidatus Nanoarchaeia archaeon]